MGTRSESDALGIQTSLAKMKKSIITLIVLQVLATVAAAFGIVEREAVFFVTAVLVIFTALRPLEEGLILFILSIPFFFALPFSESFDSMANWRVLSSILFLKYLYAEGWLIGRSFKSIRIKLSELYRSKLFWAAFVFLGWGFLSALLAPYPVIGIKKVIFLGNIFALFPIVRYVMSKGYAAYGLSVVRFVLYTVLGVGFLQLASLFFIPLERFWRFWAGHVIPIFYGYNLGELLQTSNTWFASAGDGPPVLRMFSVFPDSHSFAMLIMMGLTVLVANYPASTHSPRFGFGEADIGQANRFSDPSRQPKILDLKYIIPVIFAFLALVFSGSRGVWVSAVTVALFIGAGYIWLYKKEPAQYFEFRYLMKKTLALFLLFGILFLPASFITSLSQRAQGANADSLVSLKRVKSITDLEEISNRSRLQIWKAALNTVVSRPVFGVGFGNFSIALGEDISASRRGASAHNLYLDLAGE
ncbi:MAG: O-antigen ligase family protein, partial [bacterium]|nr:O-antigen ligase family protein [bacterium]